MRSGIIQHRPEDPGANISRRLIAIVMGLILMLGNIPGLIAPGVAHAAPDTISGMARVVGISRDGGPGGSAEFDVTINGRVYRGYCQNHGWPMPVDGDYPYTGTIQPDGSYSIFVDSSYITSDPDQIHPIDRPHLIGAPPYKTQSVGGFSIRIDVTVNFTKVSADAKITSGNTSYAYAGAVYDIYDAGTDGKIASIATNEHGSASCKLAPNKSYYAVETKAPRGFTVNPERIYFTTGDSTSSERLVDEPGYVKVTVAKKDSATLGPAQVGVSLRGAEFKCVSLSTPGWEATATTDRDGTLAFDRVPLGEIVVTETKAPIGYKLDPTPHKYTVTPDRLTDAGVVELEPEDDFKEDVIAFDLEIVKYQDTGDDGSGLQDPAVGVRFDIISNSSGKKVGTIETDADGRATTEGEWFGDGMRPEGVNGGLPYDAKGYTVHEDPESRPEGYDPCPDWQILPEQMADGATLSYIVDNAMLDARIRIVKTDSESGQTVPLAGFTFKLLDEDRNPITQEVWYPNHAEIDEFTTDGSGMVTFPEALRPGTYHIREIAARPPYILNGEDMKIVIADDPDLSPVAIVKFSDDQAKGVASIEKSCKDADCPYCTDEGGLEGAEFDVVAQEDIATPDGTVQAAAGEVVDHVITGEDGTAKTGELSLGDGTAKYAFVETKAPDGHVLDTTPIPFTLSWQDDETETVYATAEASDAPTETVIEKTVMGHDDVLPGAEFTYWAAKDEIDLDANGIAVRLSDRKDDGAKVTATQLYDHAIIGADLPDGYRLLLTDEVGDETEISSLASIPEGDYKLRLVDTEGADSKLSGDTEVAIKNGESYSIEVKDTFFGGMTSTLVENGPISDPIELAYDKESESYTCAVSSQGDYEVGVDGEKAIEVSLSDGGRAFVSQREDSSFERVPILLTDGRKPSVSVTDETGKIAIKHLTKGAYRIVETKAPDGFVIDPEVRSFTIDDDGMTEGAPSHVFKVEDDYTKVEISKRDITDEAEIEGAKLTITDAEGNVVDSWTSGKEPHRIEALAPGEYALTEEMTPNNYDKAQSVDFTVLATGEVQRVVMYDEPIEISGEIDKRQEIADPTAPDTTENGDQQNKAPVTTSEDGLYDYSLDYRSTSTTWTDEFTVEDALDAARGGLAHLVGITTAQAHEDYDGLMNVWCKTDKTPADYIDPSGANATTSDGHENPWLSEDPNGILGDDGRAVDYTGWKLWKADVSTTEATELKVADLGLAEDEHVTAIRLEYGRVEEGFATRLGSWDRGDLKSGHDDLTDVKANHEVESFKAGDVETSYAPAIIHMQVTDAYKEGTQLDNSAKVHLWRNGGGNDLEDRDKDYVAQVPKTIASPLDQTGSNALLPVLATGALATACAGAYTWRRRRTEDADDPTEE